MKFYLLHKITPKYLIFFSILCVLCTSQCSSDGGSFVRIFDSGFPTENVIGSGLTVDESSGSVYIVTSYPAILKMDLQGLI